MQLTQKHRRYLFISIYLLFLCMLGECSARGFWLSRGVPFFTAHREVYRSFYPKIPELQRNLQKNNSDDSCFDILMLGGSVLHNKYGDIEHVLQERLIRETRHCVRIYNLAEPAHTTLDSYFKYLHLQEQSFDLVMVYHGINEVRANNCLASQFKEDYSHFSWYRLILDFEARADSRWFVLPYTVKFVALKAAGRLGWSAFLSEHEPDADSLEFGCEVKTADSFKHNIERIAKIAKEKNEPLVLMTFSYYLDENYNRDDFEARKLDYSAHSFPVELWGRADCVTKALDAHNDVIRAMDTANSLAVIDQEKLIPDNGLHFNDICHFTHEGCEKFVENLLPAILPHISPTTRGDATE